MYLNTSDNGRGLGALEGLTWESARLQVASGDQLSPGIGL